VKTIVWFDEVGKNDVGFVGGKGANLGEMTQAGIPVPPGFIVTADSYFYFIEKSDLGKEIKKVLVGLDHHNNDDLQEAAIKCKDIINNAAMLQEIDKEIRAAYKKMGEGLVAVRSSATAEDLPEASFAGQQRTYLNIEGEDEVVAAVQGCWASLFEARAIFYRGEQGFDHFQVGIAVPVQRMVQSETSGVMFTVDPINSDKTKTTVEAVYGLGEAIVSGEATPDHYLVDKASKQIVKKEFAKQTWQLIRNVGVSDIEETNIKVDIPEAEQSKQKITDEVIIALTEIAQKLEDLYQWPQDIEWATQDGKLYIVQTRPITTIKEAAEQTEHAGFDEEPILTGSAASPGISAGLVKVIKDPSEIGLVKEGDILVAEMTTPDYVPAMKKAIAIVTDQGGRTCHAAIVSRELGVPCVVGTMDATAVLKTDQAITVDGFKGKVYDGELVTERIYAHKSIRGETLQSRTKIYVNLAEPELADMVSARNVDGVGLLRAEFMIAQIGEHPNYMIKEGRGEQYVQKLEHGMRELAAAFDPRPVVYRTTDFKTNEYRNLKGGEEFEGEEENPMIGYRGCSRYIDDIESFKLELEAIKRVRKDHKNLHVMLPFVRTVAELRGVKKIMADEGLERSDEFKLWMMVEVPSNVMILDKFLDEGVDGVSIGSNDLTQLILGIDRDSAKLAEIFDERNEAVLVSLEKVIRGATARGVTASICGQAPSVYPDLTKKLVEWGITSVSVSPDMIEHTRELVHDLEAELDAQK
jgi:pyruvate,water dikinase